MSYEQKYIKYKKKYIMLKNNIGGGCEKKTDVLQIIKNTTTFNDLKNKLESLQTQNITFKNSQDELINFEEVLTNITILKEKINRKHINTEDELLGILKQSPYNIFMTSCQEFASTIFTVLQNELKNQTKLQRMVGFSDASSSPSSPSSSFPKSALKKVPNLSEVLPNSQQDLQGTTCVELQTRLKQSGWKDDSIAPLCDDPTIKKEYTMKEGCKWRWIDRSTGTCEKMLDKQFKKRLKYFNESIKNFNKNVSDLQKLKKNNSNRIYIPTNSDLAIWLRIKQEMYEMVQLPGELPPEQKTMYDKYHEIKNTNRIIFT
jgi:hypothetical protein